MDGGLFTQTQDHGIGSWHPAMRPNSSNLGGADGGQSTHQDSRENNSSQIRSSQQLPNGSNGFPKPEQTPSLMRGETSQSVSAWELSPHASFHTEDDPQDPPTDTENKGSDNDERRTEVERPEEPLGHVVDARNFEGMGAGIVVSHAGYENTDEEPPAKTVHADDGTNEELAAPFLELTHAEDVLGGKEEIDMAWTSEQMSTRQDTLSGINRTNSFPEVPPLRQANAMPPHSLPHSQAENIMEEDEFAKSLDLETSSNTFTLAYANEGLLQDPFTSLEDEEGESFFTNRSGAQTAASPSQANEEARYEEGLPLVPSYHAQSSSPKKFYNGVEAGLSQAEEDEDGFFDKALSMSPEDSSSFRPQPLDRKSTTQVLDSMHYVPHSASHTEPDTTEDRPSSANFIGGGIAISESTVKPQVFAEQREDLEDSQPKDEDLAEMWKAALGDDDLLEESETSVDPIAFFEEDGEGFLEDSQDQAIGETQSQSKSFPLLEPVRSPKGTMQGFGEATDSQASSRTKYLPASASQSVGISPTYAQGQAFATTTQQLSQPAFGLSPSISAPTGFAEAARQQPYTSYGSSPRPSMPPSTQSFADKSKGGYTSPYDLPMDVTRPKKRPHFQQIRPNPEAQAAPHRPPPPRSSSMFTGAPPPPLSQPPLPSLPKVNFSAPMGNASPPVLDAKSSSSSFFEELPSTKPRPSASMGRTAPPASEQTPPPPLTSRRDVTGQPPIPQQAPIPSGNSQPYQLLPPERMSLYGNAPQSEPVSQVISSMHTRYSPAPVQQSSVPPPRARYAASPSGAVRPSSTQAQPFQPRTSSPLAHSNSLPPQIRQAHVPDSSLHRPQRSDGQDIAAQDSMTPSFPFPDPQIQKSTVPKTAQNESTGVPFNHPHFRESPPPMHTSNYAPLSDSPSGSFYAINTPEPDRFSSDGSSSFQHSQETRINPLDLANRGPPRRSQTQSPGAGFRPELPVNSQNMYQRPASVNDHIISATVEATSRDARQARPQGRTSTFVNYIKPSDGREMDHLERWKGCPIFTFGFGGAIVTSFPKQIPRYTAGQNTPMIKCSPGEIKLQDGKILPLDEDIKTFPGPLKSKGKKKEVLDWLQVRISQLENGERPSAHSTTLPDPRKRHVEKTLLWKIVRVLVEHDGVVDGSLSAEKAVRSILSPELSHGDAAFLPLHSFNAPLLGISRHEGSHSISDVKTEAVEDLRKILLHGEREKAVWHAVDNRLWGHAMILSSTLDRSVWRQVSQEFVRQEVKTFGENTESLAALYQIFAGNWDESVDELVPPSARAGLQMVSKTAGTGPTKNALDGLDRWRETLTLVLSNRSADDSKALVALGNLLAGYGRTEAAHICYIFAKSPGLFGGPDEHQVSVALLGADHIQHPFDYGRNMDSILLTEIYDFALTTLASASVATVSPHLQSYKLHHAMILAEYGYKSEAQQYCEIISNALKSTTKPSPYYHNILFGALDNLIDRLRQAPRDSSGSWISKPSMDKVSGSIWAKFNQYVAGDESDAAGTAPGKALDQNAGPFARVPGDSPNLSRTPSSTDLYSSYPSANGLVPLAPMANPSHSRYAPAGLYTPRSSLEQPDRSLQEHQRPMPSDSLRPNVAHQQYQSRPTSSTGSYNEPYKISSQSSGYPPYGESYLPTPPSQPEYMPVAPLEEPSLSLYQQEPYQPTPPLEPQPPQEQHQPLLHSESTSSYEPATTSGYEPQPINGYEPPSVGSYEPSSTNGYSPPSYDPKIPASEEFPVEEKPQIKSFMDDDEDDFEARAAAIRKEEKARKDREVDEAFRKAAEADGKLVQPPSV